MIDNALTSEAVGAAPAVVERRTSRSHSRFWQWMVGPGVIIIVWCLLTYSGAIDRSDLPSPTDLWQHFLNLLANGYLGVPLIEHIRASLTRTLTGFLLAVVTGVPLGVAMGHYPWLGRLMRPILSFLRPMPPIAFIPLAILYLGLGEASKIALIYFASLMYILVNAEAGARAAQLVLLRAGRSLGLNSVQVFFQVVIPSALPSILAGLRVGLAVSWGVVVAAELLAAQSGLGYMIQTAGTFFDLKTVYVGIFIIGIIGFGMDAIVMLIQRRVLHWQGR